MAKEFSRTQQLAAVMQRQLSMIIQRKLDDPRINPFVSISAVKITKDLSFAKVYITSLESDEKQQRELIKVLNRAGSFIRTALSHELSIRKIPELTFIYDSSIAYGNRLSQIIDDAASSDDTEE